ncbi:hypothetical protein DFR68_107307 [Nocardia mexicana]|uniref:Uncharacterized protein n=1 Tax=Nocardia mexicana TaxID=279262 RepID=A0A370H0V0_9NOCA|nr:hypothetical protein DFR68_107307 [Nocardia mexicana]
MVVGRGVVGRGVVGSEVGLGVVGLCVGLGVVGLCVGLGVGGLGIDGLSVLIGLESTVMGPVAVDFTSSGAVVVECLSIVPVDVPMLVGLVAVTGPAASARIGCASAASGAAATAPATTTRTIVCLLLENTANPSNSVAPQSLLSVFRERSRVSARVRGRIQPGG